MFGCNQKSEPPRPVPATVSAEVSPAAVPAKALAGSESTVPPQQAEKEPAKVIDTAGAVAITMKDLNDKPSEYVGKRVVIQGFVYLPEKGQEGDRRSIKLVDVINFNPATMKTMGVKLKEPYPDGINAQ